MITTARQLKDLVRNLSKKKSADAQILMRNYMMERFLERISLSEYKNQFILKGGMLVAAMVGLDARATMDLDATIKGTNVSEEGIFLPWCLAFGAFTRSRGQRERISPTPGRNHCVRCHFSESGQECPLQD